MRDAERAWTEALRAVPITAPARVLVANRTGQVIGAEDDLVELLAGQLTRPVQWAATVAALARAGATRFVSVGPSRVLRGMCRACLGADARLITANGDGLGEQERVA
jgi:[acyl-carrier-protein] S-malonyltransferase